jgi:hypothetical protein
MHGFCAGDAFVTSHHSGEKRMPNLFEDSSLAGESRRAAIFAGDIFRSAPTPAWTALSDYARSVIARHFGNLDPHNAQHEIPVERFVEIVGPLKSDFTNHPQTKELVRDVLRTSGHDLEATVFDVPRMRIVSAGGYLSAGVGYAYKAHRDTWYAAPFCQENWWSSLYDLEASQSLTFYPSYFGRLCDNTSETFDYDDWQSRDRTAAVHHVKSDTRNHPLPMTKLTEHEALRFVMPADHYLVFSGAQLHETSPNTSNTTRFSIDFRTINLHAYQHGRGAANVDSKSTGSTIVDFIRAIDFTPIAPLLQKV